jgi:predicted amidohydrolase
MRIALATPPVHDRLQASLDCALRYLNDAASRQAQLVCFPEAYLPGLRELDFPVPDFTVTDQTHVLKAVQAACHQHHIACILGMEYHTPEGRHIAAPVIDASGQLLGIQTKNQLDPSEEPLYTPGSTRQLFEIDGVKVGIVICHEGFRYPETVRWAATRGAQIVFHPHCTGSDQSASTPRHWGDPDAPYYEKATLCRALENTIYFASVNYGFRHQESASSVIDPQGKCLAHQPYGKLGVLVVDVDLSKATGLLARRLAPERYREVSSEWHSMKE